MAAFASKLQTEHKVKAIALSADASKPSDVVDVFKKVKAELGKIDVLVYNAAYFKMASVANTNLEDYEAAYRTIALGAIASAKEVLPSMLEDKKGTIVSYIFSQKSAVFAQLRRWDFP